MTTTTARPSVARTSSRPLPVPRTWGIRAADLYSLAAANVVLIVAMWLRHGGWLEFGSPSGVLAGVGQVTALLGTYAALLEIVLMSRAPFLDEAFEMDRLAWFHRWLGFATVWLIAAHVAFTVGGFALGDSASLLDEALTLVTTYPFVLLALAGFVLFVVVALSSMRVARRRMA